MNFHKVYTRDTSLIIQQSWYNSLVFASRDGLGESSNPNVPPVIYYMNDGAIEIWENEASIQWLMDAILKKNQNDSSFLFGLIKKYEVELIEFKEKWKVGSVDNVIDLKKFVDKIFKTMTELSTIIYYSAVDERTPQNIRLEALRVRDEDVFFDKNDRMIRESLIRIFPEAKNFETTILFEELDKPLKPLEILADRKNHFIMIPGIINQAENIEMFSYENSNYIFESEETGEFKDVLIGNVASGNGEIIRGVVRLMRRKEQVSEIIFGEILVSPMTTPEYLPAMQKAGAIITDEGGITCHAAIVSRELKKPCIIGTKIATQVLHDGDLVEVDAEKGIVKILERA